MTRMDEEWLRLLGALLFAVALATGVAALIPGAANAAETKILLNVSYDPTRELYQDINAAFADQAKAEE